MLLSGPETAVRLKQTGKLGPDEIAAVLAIHRTTYFRWIRRCGAQTVPDHPRKAFRKVSEEMVRHVVDEAKARVRVTQRELAADLAEKFGVLVSQQHISRLLKANRVTRKKLTIKSAEALKQPERHRMFHERVTSFDLGRLGALDESSFQLNDPGRFGYSEKGTPAVVYLPGNRGPKIYSGNMNTERFCAFLKTIRAGACGPESLGVILDNAGFHGSPLRARKTTDGTAIIKNLSGKSFLAVQAVAKANNLSLIYLRPRSPEFNPTEYVFATIKNLVRRDCPRTVPDLVRSIERAIQIVGHGDLMATFRHCLKLSEAEFVRIAESASAGKCVARKVTLQGQISAFASPAPQTCPSAMEGAAATQTEANAAERLAEEARNLGVAHINPHQKHTLLTLREVLHVDGSAREFFGPWNDFTDSAQRTAGFDAADVLGGLSNLGEAPFEFICQRVASGRGYKLERELFVARLRNIVARRRRVAPSLIGPDAPAPPFFRPADDGADLGPPSAPDVSISQLDNLARYADVPPELNVSFKKASRAALKQLFPLSALANDTVLDERFAILLSGLVRNGRGPEWLRALAVSLWGQLGPAGRARMDSFETSETARRALHYVHQPISKVCRLEYLERAASTESLPRNLRQILEEACRTLKDQQGRSLFDASPGLEYFLASLSLPQRCKIVMAARLPDSVASRNAEGRKRFFDWAVWNPMAANEEALAIENPGSVPVLLLSFPGLFQMSPGVPGLDAEGDKLLATLFLKAEQLGWEHSSMVTLRLLESGPKMRDFTLDLCGMPALVRGSNPEARQEAARTALDAKLHFHAESVGLLDFGRIQKRDCPLCSFSVQVEGEVPAKAGRRRKVAASGMVADGAARERVYDAELRLLHHVKGAHLTCRACPGKGHQFDLESEFRQHVEENHRGALVAPRNLTTSFGQFIANAHYIVPFASTNLKANIPTGLGGSSCPFCFAGGGRHRQECSPKRRWVALNGFLALGDPQHERYKTMTELAVEWFPAAEVCHPWARGPYEQVGPLITKACTLAAILFKIIWTKILLQIHNKELPDQDGSVTQDMLASFPPSYVAKIAIHAVLGAGQMSAAVGTRRAGKQKSAGLGAGARYSGHSGAPGVEQLVDGGPDLGANDDDRDEVLEDVDFEDDDDAMAEDQAGAKILADFLHGELDQIEDEDLVTAEDTPDLSQVADQGAPSVLTVAEHNAAAKLVRKAAVAAFAEARELVGETYDKLRPLFVQGPLLRYAEQVAFNRARSVPQRLLTALKVLIRRFLRGEVNAGVGRRRIGPILSYALAKLGYGDDDFSNFPFESAFGCGLAEATELRVGLGRLLRPFRGLQLNRIVDLRDSKQKPPVPATVSQRRVIARVLQDKQAGNPVAAAVRTVNLPKGKPRGKVDAETEAVRSYLQNIWETLPRASPAEKADLRKVELQELRDWVVANRLQLRSIPFRYPAVTTATIRSTEQKPKFWVPEHAEDMNEAAAAALVGQNRPHWESEKLLVARMSEYDLDKCRSSTNPADEAFGFQMCFIALHELEKQDEALKKRAASAAAALPEPGTARRTSTARDPDSTPTFPTISTAPVKDREASNKTRRARNTWRPHRVEKRHYSKNGSPKRWHGFVVSFRKRRPQPGPEGLAKKETMETKRRERKAAAAAAMAGLGAAQTGKEKAASWARRKLRAAVAEISLSPVTVYISASDLPEFLSKLGVEVAPGIDTSRVDSDYLFGHLLNGGNQLVNEDRLFRLRQQGKVSARGHAAATQPIYRRTADVLRYSGVRGIYHCGSTLGILNEEVSFVEKVSFQQSQQQERQNTTQDVEPPKRAAHSPAAAPAPPVQTRPTVSVPAAAHVPAGLAAFEVDVSFPRDVPMDPYPPLYTGPWLPNGDPDPPCDMAVFDGQNRIWHGGMVYYLQATAQGDESVPMDWEPSYCASSNLNFTTMPSEPPADCGIPAAVPPEPPPFFSFVEPPASTSLPASIPPEPPPHWVHDPCSCCQDAACKAVDCAPNVFAPLSSGHNDPPCATVSPGDSVPETSVHPCAALPFPDFSPPLPSPFLSCFPPEVVVCAVEPSPPTVTVEGKFAAPVPPQLAPTPVPLPPRSAEPLPRPPVDFKTGIPVYYLSRPDHVSVLAPNLLHMPTQAEMFERAERGEPVEGGVVDVDPNRWFLAVANRRVDVRLVAKSLNPGPNGRYDFANSHLPGTTERITVTNADGTKSHYVPKRANPSKADGSVSFGRIVGFHLEHSCSDTKRIARSFGPSPPAAGACRHHPLWEPKISEFKPPAPDSRPNDAAKAEKHARRNVELFPTPGGCTDEFGAKLWGEVAGAGRAGTPALPELILGVPAKLDRRLCGYDKAAARLNATKRTTMLDVNDCEGNPVQKSLHDFERDLPSQRTTNSAAFSDYTRALLPQLDRILDVYCSGERSLDRVRTIRRRREVLSWICRDMCRNPYSGKYDPQTTIAYGAARFGHASKGGPASRIVRFRAELAKAGIMVLVNEYLTSQMCSCCKTTYVVGIRNPGSKGEVRGVKYCPLCRRFWMRDVNSVHSMEHLFWFGLITGGERPWPFRPDTRKPKPQPKLRAGTGAAPRKSAGAATGRKRTAASAANGSVKKLKPAS